tara:strand:- start:2004 stop:6218 length:4215 start_codon:yes stop_codon:yes gene_type:complete
MSVISNNQLAGAAGQGGAAGYEISRSLRFNSADSSYLSWTPSSVGNRTTWTWSGWIKRAKLGTGQRFFTGATSTNDVGWTAFHFINDKLYISGYNTHFRISSKVFKDPGAWFHIVVKYELGASAEADKIKAWCNGEEIAWETTNAAPSQSGVNDTNNHTLGAEQSPNNGGLNSYCDLYLAEVNFIDGQALAASDFGEYDDNNVWQPKQFDGVYSTSDTTDNVYAWKATTANAGSGTGWYFTQEDNSTSQGLSGNTGGHPNELGGNTIGARNGQSAIGAYGTFATANSVTAGSSAISDDASFSSSGSSTLSFVYNKTVNKVWVYKGSSWIGGGNPSNTSSTPTFSVPSSGKLSFGIVQAANTEGLTLEAIDSSVYSGTATGITFRGSYNHTSLSSNNTVATCGGSGYSDAWSIELLNSASGANSFNLNFSNNSSNAALGTDSSGNSNNWTVNNLSVAGPSVTTTGNISLSSGNRSFYFKGSVGDELTVSSGNFVWDSSDGNTWTYRGQSGTTVTLTSAYVEISGSTGITFTNTDSDTVVYWDLALGTGLPNGTGTTDKFNIDSYGEDVIDSLIDTPMNLETSSGNNPGNYCTLNELTKTVATLSNGSLLYESHGSTQHCVGSTMAVASGKWYWEYTIESTGSYHYVGIADVATNYTGNWCGSNSGWTVSVNTSGNIAYNNAENHGNIGTAAASGQIWGWALDMDAGTLKVYINGSIQYSGNSIIPSGTSLTGRTITPAAGHLIHKHLSFNFGQRPFAYTPPTGYKSLCTTNLADPTIADGSDYFDVALWTGTGSSQTVSLDFDADLIWTKTRSNSVDHKLVDSVRGLTKVQETNQTRVDATDSNGITATSATGFTVGSSGDFNTSSRTYVGWAWDAGNLASTSSSAYNQTRTWSDNATGGRSDEPIEDLFDGSTSTFAQNPSGGSNPNNIVVTFSPGLAYTSSVEVWPQNASSCAVNNGSQTATTNGQWNTVASGSGTLTELDFQRNHTNGCSIAAIRVDGKILINPGVIPVSSLNSSVYDQSQTWSNGMKTSTAATTDYITTGRTTSFPSSFTGEEPFNADLTDYLYGQTGTAGTWIYLEFSTALTNVTSISFSTEYSCPNGIIKLNGTDVAVDKSDLGGGFVEVNVTGTIPSSLTEIAIQGHGGSSRLKWVKINGKYLLDNGVTPTNIPTIASTVRANASAGVSIVSWTGNGTNGATVGHGLSGAENGMIIVKNRDYAGVWWPVYHASLTTGKVLALNTTNTEFDETYLSRGIIESVTSAKFSCTAGTAGNETANGNGNSHIAYCFAPVEGYSAFGKYTGAADKFIYTGFKPQWLLIKSYAGDGFNWVIIDDERGADSSNISNKLYPNQSTNEDGESRGNETKVVFLSNGFTFLDTGAETNSSSRSYVYAAFASHPFKTARAS